ncbi:hypothetical protein SAY86_007457 [Trapa natans]|uniref:Uncharacterized protein n=1 Tax=Trapa natans TaxID=22666 RepID=A0AAN7LHE7_TRANT|nr:hypothetical protein SAY86_007457 [Trapa natans]
MSIGSSEVMILGDVKDYARDIVLKEIEKLWANGLARALCHFLWRGIFVQKHSEPYVVGRQHSWFSLSNQNRVHCDASKMLFPSLSEPGACFPLKESNGFVDIRLRTAIIPEADFGTCGKEGQQIGT